MKKIVKCLIIILITYLIISAIYVLFHIEFFEKSQVGGVGMGFSESDNMLRLFMGLPRTFTTDENVSPVFLVEVIVKVILAFFLIKFLKKRNK